MPRRGLASETAGALLVGGMLLIMVLPLPTPLLDLGLGLSLASALTLLFVALYLNRPLDLSTFPSILLIATLYRLSLNVASTRLILLHGQAGPKAAGAIIASFGSFVVGGNYAVGIIVFLILVVINFVVITKGAGRIAEVAARFTLDAMPGKQMSIDADLNAGLIDEGEARRRRRDIQLEADFYGAMDGASKFVRGDAIAGLLITGINLVGGLLIGVFYNGMEVAEAARTYTILTVGDGLVSQIPALVISTAAGVLTTRAGGTQDLSSLVTDELFKHRRALVLVSAVLFLFAFLPGMPAWLFLGLGGIMLLGGLKKEKPKTATRAARDTSKAPAPVSELERIEAALPVDLLGMEVGYALISMVDKQRGGELLARISSIREQTASKLGIVVPPVRIRDNLQLPPAAYLVLLRGIEVARGEVVPDRYMALFPGDKMPSLPGIPTKEPAFGLPALWIEEGNKERADALGFTVVDAASVIATHLTEVINRHADELIGRQELQQLLDIVGRSSPKVVEELLPSLMTHSELLKVLRNLLAESISIRDLRTIMETLADHAASVKDTDTLTEIVRERLSRSITAKFVDSGGRLNAIFLDPGTEEVLMRSIEMVDGKPALTIKPEFARNLLQAIQDKLRIVDRDDVQFVLLVGPDLRRPLWSLFRRFMPDLPIMSHREVDTGVEINNVAVIKV